MIRSYIRIALRNLWRNKLFSAINIGGLAVGMAVSFTLLFYVIIQFNYNNFHVNGNRIYRVLSAENGTNISPVPLAAEMVKSIPEVQATSKSDYFQKHLLQAGELSMKIEGGFVEPQFLQIFSFPVLKGNASPLKQQNEIVLTEDGARKLFKDADPIGKIVKLDASDPLVVTAVVKNPPVNSSIKFDFLCSWSLYNSKMDWVRENSWGNFSIITYALLHPDAKFAAADKKVRTIVHDKGDNLQKVDLMLHPIKDWKLYNKIKDGKEIGGGIEVVRLSIWLALAILLIACVNFMNLSTAQAERRAREVGVRKAIGAKKGSLMLQFFGESMILVSLSAVLALLLMWAWLPAFNSFASCTLQLSAAPLLFWGCLITILLLTGLIAGSYPAFVLSSFQPVKVLKGTIGAVKGTFRPRQILVVFQFGISVVLIIVTMVIFRQLHYIQNRPIGYDPKGLVDVVLEGQLYEKYETFKQAAIASGAVVDGTIVSSSITSSGSTSWGLKWSGQEQGDEEKRFGVIATTTNFANTFSIPLVEGRDFISEADSMSMLLNEAAVKEMRFKNPVGQQIIYNGQKRLVTGVLKNFAWINAYQPATPMVFTYNPSWRGAITFKINPTISLTAAIDKLQKVYRDLNPDYPFEYSFVNDDYQRKYDYERFMGKLINTFALLAVIISCLGLFGLSVFAAAQRRKEIGIRKVMGAGVQQVTMLLSAEFLKPVLIAIVIASPIAAYIMNGWLQRYTYRIGLDWWMFMIAGIIAIMIAILTVSIQSIKAANMNPVKALRSE